MATAGRLDIEIQARMSEGKMSVDALKKSFDALGYSVDSVQQKVSKVVVGKGANKHLEDQVRYTATYNDGLKKVTQTWNEQGQVIKSTATQTKKAFDTGRLLWYFNILRGVWNKFKNIEGSAMDFNETIEKFNVSMGTSAEKAQLFQDKMANAIGTSRAEMMNYQSNFKNIMAGLGAMSTETAEKISESLTKMTLDYSSLFNTSQAGAANKIQAALTGAIMPIRRESGYDVSKNAVSQKVSELGVEKTYTQLTETEKRLVRIMLLMDQMKNTGAFNDLARTIESPANQIKVLKNQLQELGIWLGNVFMGTIGAILPYINGFIMALKEIIKLFAIFVGYTPIGTEIAQPLEEAAESVDDINTGFGGASKKAKELKKQLQGFDVLNVIQTPPQSGGGGGGGSPMGVDPAILGALKDYDSLMEKVRMKAADIRDKILEWLGFFSEDGGLTWQLREGETNLRKILDVAKALGGVFLGYKLSKPILNLFNTLSGGELGNIQLRAAGIGLTVGGLTLFAGGIQHVIEDGKLTPWSLLEILSGGAFIAAGITLTAGKTIPLKMMLGVGLAIAGVTLLFGGIQKIIDNGFSPEALMEVVFGGAAAIAGGAILFKKIFNIDLGAAIKFNLSGITPAKLGIGIVTAAVAGLVTFIVSQAEKAKKAWEEKIGTIFQGFGQWSNTLNNAKSYLSGFNTELFATNEEQENLSKNMNDIQGKITDICRTAIEERRGLTQAEMDKIDEYFKKLEQLANRELEIQKNIGDAIFEQAKTASKNFQGTAEEYKQTGANWIKTANEQKDKIVKIASDRATQEIVLLTQEYETAGKLQDDEYERRYNAIIENKNKEIKAAEDQVGEISSIYSKGYGDRLKESTSFGEKYQQFLDGMDKAEQEYNNSNKFLFEANANALGKWGKSTEDTFNNTIGSMSQAEKDSVATWLEWISETQVKGGELTEEDQRIADNMLAAFDKMGPDMKEKAKQSMQGMLDGMKSREPDLYSKASGIAGSILSRLQKSFDIHSPSKKTRKIFTQVMQGMELGLADEEDKLYNQTEDIADNTMDALQPKGKMDILEAIKYAFRDNDAENLGYTFGQNIAVGINEGIAEKVQATLAPLTASTDIAVGGLPDVGRMFGGEVAFAGSVGNASTGFGSDFLTQAVSQGVASAMSRMSSNQGGSYNLYIDGEQITDVVQKRINRNANIFGR